MLLSNPRIQSSIVLLLVLVGCADDPAKFMPAEEQTWPAAAVEAVLVDENGQIQHEEMTFEQALETPDKTVVVDFWAQWCGPCRMLAPELETLARDRSDILVVKVNVDDNPKLALQMQVGSIPAIHVLKDGQWMGRTVGFRDADGLSQFVTSLVP